MIDTLHKIAFAASNTYMIDTLHKIAFAALQNYNNF